jgi:hypothetical protein
MHRKNHDPHHFEVDEFGKIIATEFTLPVSGPLNLRNLRLNAF